MNQYSGPRLNGSRRRVARAKQRNVSPLPDKKLATVATNAISSLTTVPLEGIRVTVRKGWLYLRGEVSGTNERMLLEQVTRPLIGVRGVTNSLMVQSASSS
jgi:osmotically-inducible protein OsmY